MAKKQGGRFKAKYGGVCMDANCKILIRCGDWIVFLPGKGIFHADTCSPKPGQAPKSIYLGPSYRGR